KVQHGSPRNPASAHENLDFNGGLVPEVGFEPSSKGFQVRRSLGYRNWDEARRQLAGTNFWKAGRLRRGSNRWSRRTSTSRLRAAELVLRRSALRSSARPRF